MSYHSIVLVKQVPDTKNVTAQAMKEDGTVNRAALPAIFNPEDLNALEMALSIKDQYGGTVTVLTMGPPAAAAVLRESLYRGADNVALITDRRFAGADTLATSYTLSAAVKSRGDFSLVLCGRQAIDGDTAQVGPQIADKLDLPQLTYVEKVNTLNNGVMEVTRGIGGGVEVVKSSLPLLMTVGGAANDPRPARAKLIMKYKKACTPRELLRRVREEMGLDEKEAKDNQEYQQRIEERTEWLSTRGLLIPELSADDIEADLERCGLKGSPTKVKKIESVILAGNDHKSIEPTDAGVTELVKELIDDHTLG